MPEPVIESEKKACPIAVTHTIGSSSLLKSGINRNLYPSSAFGSIATFIAKMANNTKNSGIIILLVFSMLFAPKNSVRSVPTITIK